MFTVEKIIKENKTHKEDVLNMTKKACEFLLDKACEHDNDKNIKENAQVLANALNGEGWQEWNEIHLLSQRHHAEWIINDISSNISSDVSLFDLLEMVVDGLMANHRRTGEKRTWQDEVAFFERKGFDQQLAIILANTFIQMQEWLEKKEQKTTAKERVEIEVKELKEKFEKLVNFIGTEKYNSLEEPQRKWLCIQKMHMEGYIDALEARLELWEE